MELKAITEMSGHIRKLTANHSCSMTPLRPETPIDPEQDALQPSLISADVSLKKPKKDKKNKASKGVETLFRTTMSNHIKLSEMAGRKANLMISINTIVVSITLSAYVHKFDAPDALLIPSALLLAVCLITIVVALIATNPTITQVTSRNAPPKTDQLDLLFFGSYTQLTADKYWRDLRKLLNNEDDLYNSLIDNVYTQGQVLARKYRLLKFCLPVFYDWFPNGCRYCRTRPLFCGTNSLQPLNDYPCPGALNEYPLHRRPVY